MIGILRVAVYLHTWQTTLKWFVVVGACLTIAGVLLGAVSGIDANLVRAWLVLGPGFALLIPLLPMPTAVRALLGHQMVSMSPTAHRAVGLAVLASAMLMAAVIGAGSHLTGGDGWRAAALAFTGISLYHALAQRALGSRWVVLFSIQLVAAFLLFLILAPELAARGVFDPVPVFAATAVVVAGWAWSLRRLGQQSLFHRPAPDAVENSIRVANRLVGRQLTNAPLSLLLGYPTTLNEQLRTATLAVVLVPLATAVVSVAPLPLVDGGPHAWRAYSLIEVGIVFALIISVVNTWLASSSYSLVRRSRALWLRAFGTRAELWRQLETPMLHLLFCFWLAALGVALLSTLSAAARPYLPLYLIGVITGSLASAYLSIWRGLGLPILWPGLLATGLMLGFGYGVLAEHNFARWACPAGAALLAGLLRGRARQAYDEVSWSAVRPDPRERRRLTTVKLW